MSFRTKECITSSLDSIIDGIAAVIHYEISRGYDKDSVKKAVRPFLIEAYRAGYYDGKGDALENLLMSKLMR